jgi:FKBP-type peptidyl-prolyl cis-trans isomerase 2
MKKGDFIEVEYTGRTADTKEVFDTTSETIAKKEGIFSSKTKYGDVIVVLGDGHMIPGLEKRLEGKEVGKHTFQIPDVEAFGKKSASLLKLIPASAFKQEKMRPYPGLQINVDGQIGVVKTVSGGRIIVDFNHPLSSRDVEYDIHVKRILNDTKEKIESLFKLFNLPYEEIILTNNGNDAVIRTKVPYPDQLTGHIIDDLKRMISLKEVTFETMDDKKEIVENKKNENKLPKEHR